MFKIEFLKPAIVEGRTYLPGNQDQSVLRTHSGKDRRFNSFATALNFAVECFGNNYSQIMRIIQK